MEKWEEELEDIFKQQGFEINENEISDKELWEFAKTHSSKLVKVIIEMMENFPFLKEALIEGMREGLKEDS